MLSLEGGCSFMSLPGRLHRGLAVIGCSISLSLAVAGCQHNATATAAAVAVNPTPVASSPVTSSPLNRDTTTDNGGGSYSVGDAAAPGLTNGAGYGAGNSSGTAVGPTGVTSGGGSS